MFDKLFEAQQKAEEIKKRLDTISVSAEVEGGKIRVSSTANKRITGISIDPDFMANADTEELEELLTTVINKALEQAESVSQTEMQAATRDMMGGLGNLFGNK
ncbi:YbaB/EbfC family nucleoid-associated protein [Daejeonella sp.]|uniref:YbaB/EbfC family nucleoid-associated protein n=1 Tax=Daejeonella sp. TaxID=2805397 RepID=UPI00398302FC